MKSTFQNLSILFFALVLLLCANFADAQVSPFGGLGNAQFFDNNGELLTAGVLYSYQAGSTTQQATYTDSTGTIQNPNPIPFSSGARVSIWLSSGALYKFVLCLQNDGAFCAPSDVLFSVDQVPGAASGGSSGGGSSPFTGTFISGSANPASSGILRLSSGDTVCWRNVAGSANLCFRKDTNDLLSWDGGSLKFPEVGAPGCVPGFDQIWADNSAHRWKFCNNGSTSGQIVSSGVDINTSDQVVNVHFGAAIVPLCNTAPVANELLQYNGSQACWYGAEEIMAGPQSIPSLTSPCTLSGSGDCIFYTFGAAHLLTRLTVATSAAPSGCSPNAIIGVKDMTSGTVLLSATPTATGVVTTTGFATLPAGDVIAIGLLTAGGGACTSGAFTPTAVYE